MRNLVILGGGYGGFRILYKLLDQDLPDDIEITVIDKNPYHSLQTEFYTIAAGTVADKEVRIDFPKNDRVTYVFGEVNQIDVEQEEIRFANWSKVVSYDYLVRSEERRV